MEARKRGAEEALRTIIGEVSWGGIAPASLRGGDRLKEDMGLDSVALIDLIVALESRLGVYINPLDPADVRAFDTFGSLSALVSERGVF